MREFKVNEYLTLKLENGETFIHVNGKRFLQCIRLVLQIPKDNVQDFEQVNSIDEAVEVTKHLYQNQIVQGDDAMPARDHVHSITPEQEFLGIC